MRAQILTAPNLTRPLPDLASAAEEERGTGTYPAGKRRDTAGEETVLTLAGAGPDRAPSVPPRTVLSEKEVENLPF
jgi:hypothetical protein